MTTRGLLAIGVLLALDPAPAASQTMDTAPLQAFSKTAFYKGLIERAIGSVPPVVVQRCPTLASSSSTTIMLKQVSFAQDGYPVAGLWRQSFPVSGCGNDTVLNFYFSATPDEKVNTTIGAPGTTRADLLLQKDAYSYAAVGAGLVVKACQAFTVTNTRFEGFGLANPPTPDPGPGARARPWWETWTMAGCGKTAAVPIDFVPHPPGTDIIQPGGGKLL